MTQETLNTRIKNELEKARNIVITAHIRPDGDAVGSVLGLAQALREKGKNVETVLQDRIDEKFLVLAGGTEIKTAITTPYDYLIVVDCADRARAGGVLDDVEKVDLTIDHHISHINFGEIDFLQSDYEATALILFDFLPQWGVPLSKESAECLMTGILSDTIGFRTSSTTPKSLKAVAEMMDMGVNLSEVYFRTLSSRTLSELRYWAQGLEKIHLEDDVVWTALSLEDREKSGYDSSDDADLINHLSSMKGAKMAIIFVEQPNGRVKVSWRSVPGVNVSVLAETFGGGGHAAASGADITGSLSEVIQSVICSSKAYLSN